MESVGQSTARLECITGGMYSGKTEELLRRVRLAEIARQLVLLCKPLIDTRYGEEQVVSHNKTRLPAKVFRSSEELLTMAMGNPCPVVAIEELQFFDDGIVDVCETLVSIGKRVIVAGLDQDYKGEPFWVMAQLLARAEHVLKLQAICAICGEFASKTQRLLGGTARIEVGGVGQYEARCRKHHTKELFSIDG